MVQRNHMAGSASHLGAWDPDSKSAAYASAAYAQSQASGGHDADMASLSLAAKGRLSGVRATMKMNKRRGSVHAQYAAGEAVIAQAHTPHTHTHTTHTHTHHTHHAQPHHHLTAGQTLGPGPGDSCRANTGPGPDNTTSSYPMPPPSYETPSSCPTQSRGMGGKAEAANIYAVLDGMPHRARTLDWLRTPGRTLD